MELTWRWFPVGGKWNCTGDDEEALCQPFHSSVDWGRLTPPLPQLSGPSSLCELPGQLGAVFLTCVSLSEAFFPVSRFQYSVSFLVTCQSVFTRATFKLNIANTCSQPCCRPSPPGSPYNLPGTYTPQLLTQVWPPVRALSDGQWLTCHLASCYQLWSGRWAVRHSSALGPQPCEAFRGGVKALTSSSD